MKSIQAACFCFLLLAFPGSATAQTGFDTQQRAALAQNPAGLTCTLRTADGKTEFHPGEIIRITLDYTADKPGQYRLNPWVNEQMPRDVFRVSPTEGVADPRAGLSDGGAFSSYIPPPLPITNQSTSLTLTLNERLRFDRPGAYRLYVLSKRILDGGADSSAGVFMTGRTVTSSVLSLTILPPDPVWAHAQVQSALAQLGVPDQGARNQGSPLDTLRYLGTPEAAQALLSVLAADRFPRSSESSGWICRLGLIGYPDRKWLVAEMQRDLVAPNYTVTQTFLGSLAWLAGQQQQAKDEGSLEQSYWKQAADAVPTKTASALPMTLHTLLETAWLDARVGTETDIQARTPVLKRRLAPIFDQLPPLAQEYLLGDEWERMRTPALLPALRRLWAKAVRPDNNDYESNDLVLRRLYDLAPSEGRMLILREASSLCPRVTIAALRVLPDRTLPALEKTLAAHLSEPDADADTTCQLIERYGTPAIFPQVRAYFNGPQSLASSESLLAYFLRVQPAYGEQALHRQLLHWLGRGSGETLISDVALIRDNPLMEQIAVAGLDNPDPGVVADAARALGQQGSAHAVTALWSRLRRAEAAGRSRAIIEEALVSALATGQNWYAGPAQLRQIRTLCVTAEGRQQVTDIQNRLSGKQVHVDYEIGDVGWWTIGQYNGKGAAAFFAKMTQFPRGTAFSWQEIGFGPAEELLMNQAHVIARAHGMTIQRWRPIARGRT